MAEDLFVKMAAQANVQPAEAVDLTAAPAAALQPKPAPPAAPKNLPGANDGGRQFGEVHDTAKASGERLNQSALAMAQTAITLAKLGRLGNVALTKLLNIEELVKFDPAIGNEGKFTIVARAWVAEVVNPDVSKLEVDDKRKYEAAKTDEERENVLHGLGENMIAAAAVKIQDFITAEDDRVAEWVNTSRKTMVETLGRVTGALVKK
jgi:hypothetical protein